VSVLEELEGHLRRALGAVGPSLVTIGRDGRGTGLVVGPNRVLTNAHNLRDRTTQITFADGRSVQAELSGSDTDGDLVVLEADTGGAPAVAWASGAPVEGTIVFAVSRGGGHARVTFGSISGVGNPFRGPRGRRLATTVEHTAPLARGASGGALVDREGRVLGVNTHRAGGGFYLALVADEAFKARVNDLAAGKSVVRPTLGLALAPAEVAARLRRAVGLPERAGLLVRRVRSGSPADQAGIAGGDLLVAAGGSPLTSIDALHAVLDNVSPGSTLSLTIVRGTEERTVTVTFPADDVGDQAGAPDEPDNDARGQAGESPSA